MKGLDLSGYAFGICAAAAILAGCSGSQAPIGTPGVMQQSRAITPQAGGDGSWMLPEAKTEDLLYATNVYTVTVYDYKTGKHVGTLKHFYGPEYECSDAIGDVFITNGGDLLEYAHGGKKSIATFSTSGYYPFGCAVDPTTGNLAVTLGRGGSYSGEVAVYPQAKGTPTIYGSSTIQFAFCGYDNAGNLFLDGWFTAGGITFLELPSGGSSFETVTLNQEFYSPGAVQWDGKYLAVGDDQVQKIYQFSISGSSGTLQGTTNLGSSQTVVQWWIRGGTVVGADDGPSTVWYWKYPAGGSPTKSITKNLFHPVGITLSVAKK